jgi:hypothetical protein
VLAVGTAPMGDENADGFAARRRARPEDLRRQLQLIDVGPAGAVENVEELYEAGLPEGLPGGLALVAIQDRETLLAVRPQGGTCHPESLWTSTSSSHPGAPVPCNVPYLCRPATG